MKKQVKKPAEAECPLEIHWGTFCRGVLSEGLRRTIYDVVPSLAGEIKVKGPAEDSFNASIGKMSMYTLFRRRDGVKGKIEVVLQLELLNVVGAQPLEARLVLEPQHDYYHQSSNIDSAMVSVPCRAGKQQVTVSQRVLYRGKEVGRVNLPISITVTKEV